MLSLRSRDLHCQQAIELLTDYLEGSLSRRQRRRLEAHLRDCPNCSNYLEQIRITIRLTGEMTPDDLMLVQVGSGENGKTTVMSAFGAVLGTYYHVVSHRALLADARAIDTEVADFQGVRLAVMEETPEEHRLSPVRLKRLVGTPEITARHLYHGDRKPEHQEHERSKQHRPQQQKE